MSEIIMQGLGPQDLPAPWFPSPAALLPQGGCGAEAAEGRSGGPEKAARRCCTAATARGKTGEGSEEGGGATLFER